MLATSAIFPVLSNPPKFRAPPPRRSPLGTKIFPKNVESAFGAVDVDVKRRIIRKEAGGVLLGVLPVCLRSTFNVDFEGGRVAEWQTLGI